LLLFFRFPIRNEKRANEKIKFPWGNIFKEGVMFSFGSFAIALAVFAIVVLFLGVKTVPQGYEYTVERWGKFTKTLKPGLHIIIPVVDKLRFKQNMMEQVLDIEKQDVISKDNAMVSVNGVLYFQIDDAAKSSYEVNRLEYAITNLALTNIRTVLGGMELDEMLSKRDAINAELLRVIDAATNPWGVKATRVEIKDIQPPQDLIDSMARQMKAERDKRAQVLEAEGFKQAEILKAEGAKQAAVLEAEGRREAAFRDAEARERQAEAEAKATRDVSKAISEGDVNAVNYFVAMRYIESLEQIGSANNSKMIFMPLEAAGVIGSIGGISDLVKDAMKKEA
jgi:regulator of protease activity HflC (stomatin/prohibitin superfamily)